MDSCLPTWNNETLGAQSDFDSKRTGGFVHQSGNIEHSQPRTSGHHRTFLRSARTASLVAVAAALLRAQLRISAAAPNLRGKLLFSQRSAKNVLWLSRPPANFEDDQLPQFNKSLSRQPQRPPGVTTRLFHNLARI